MSTEHNAAMLNSKGGPLVITRRQTPTPGPNEVLLKVHSLALNPVDHIQQSMGFNISKYPYILGFDVSGTVQAVGSSVTNLAVNDRVLAGASSWFSKDPNGGAFQEYVIAPVETVTPIPADITFNEASILPLAMFTAWHAIFGLDIPRESVFQLSDKKGILIWGVSGSVGSVALQIAKIMGFHVYGTASQKHHEYLQGLGQGPGKVKLFDYKDKNVVSQIISAAAADGVVLELAIEAAAGNLNDIVSVLNKTKAKGTYAKISCAPFSVSMLWYTNVPSFFTGVSAKFVLPAKDPKVMMSDFAFVHNTWLPAKLASKELVPSPHIQIIPGGLPAVQAGLDELKKGVSGVKLVLEVVPE